MTCTPWLGGDIRPKEFEIFDPKECQGHEAGFYHSGTATEGGRVVCDRCGLLKPIPVSSVNCTGENDDHGR